PELGAHATLRGSVPPERYRLPGIRRGSAGVAAGRLDGGAACFESGDRDAERRARHVVEPDLVAEVHGVGVAAVFAADADLQVGPGLAALFDRDPHQPADAVTVERLERRHTEDAEVHVAAEERALDVVAGKAPAHLGEVVGAEAEELGLLGDLSGG